MKVKLLPFCTVDGIPTFKDSEIGYLYTMLEKEGRAEAAFCDGSARDAEEFIQLMKSEDNKLWVVTVENKIKGIAWLNNFRQTSAFGHFAFYKTAASALKIARETMRQLIYMKNGDEFVFSVLMGFVSANNKKAVEFIKRMGMTVIGEVPDAVFDYYDQKTYNAVLFYITRKEV